MIYLVAGALLSKVSLSLRENPPVAGDALAAVQQRRASALLLRLSRIWPALFSTLRAENNLLEQAISTAQEQCHRSAPPDLVDQEENIGAALDPLGELPDDPLARYAQLLRQADAMVVLLHSVREQDWAREARRQFRRELGAASALQSTLLTSGGPQ